MYTDLKLFLVHTLKQRTRYNNCLNILLLARKIFFESGVSNNYGKEIKALF